MTKAGIDIINTVRCSGYRLNVGNFLNHRQNIVPPRLERLPPMDRHGWGEMCGWMTLCQM
jgi:hypothetical protein